jgi:protoporphyrinogen oxidase
MRVAVLGSGPMGLMCALDLRQHGCDVDVYERDDRIGGMSASFDFDGLKIERYYHFICKTDRPLFELLDELGIADRLHWVDTSMGFFCDGKLYPWGTPQALLKFDKLGPIDKVRYALLVMATKNVDDWRTLDRTDAVTWLKRWLGERSYRVLWERLLELKLHEHATNLSAAWLGTRIKRIALSRRNLLHESLGYIEGGSDALLERMHRVAVGRGIRVHLGAQVSRVIAAGGRVAGVLANGTESPADAVFSTIPLRYVPGLAPDLPDDFKERINAIENIPVVCVILKLKHRISANFWMNICDARIDIPGIIEYSNLNPVDGSAIVYAPFYMPKMHPKFARTNAEFIEEVLGYLPSLNPAFSRDWILATHCHRYEFAQTISPPGFYEMLPPMHTPMKGFYMADTAYYYPEDRSISESVRVGRQLAQLATAGLA